ncbi:NAD(P)-dependent oxidoreductase, partial [Streptococcus suis]
SCHQVTDIVRSENKIVAKELIQKDSFALTKEDLAGFDVLVNAFGAWTPETLPDHSRLAAHLATILAGSPTRLLVVSGAG